MRAGRAGAAAKIFAAALVLLLAGCVQSGETKEKADNTDTAQDAGSWYYDAFDEELKAVFEAFERSADSPWSTEPVQICDKNGSPLELPVSKLNTAYQGFLYDNPGLFWLGRSFSYRVSRSSEDGEYADAVMVIPLAGSQEELDKYTFEFENAAQELLDKTQRAESDRQLAEQIYDRLAENTEYFEEALYDESLCYEHTAYGAVVSKRAVCDGFALAYKYLLDRCGIQCILIPGESEGQQHVWNTVYWDGAWHETDITWDAASAGNDRRQYFDLTTEEMSKDHSREAGGIADLAPDAG